MEKYHGVPVVVLVETKVEKVAEREAILFIEMMENDVADLLSVEKAKREEREL